MGKYLCQKTKAFLGDKRFFVVLWNISLEFVINTDRSVDFFLDPTKLKHKMLQAEFVIKKRNWVKFLLIIITHLGQRGGGLLSYPLEGPTRWHVFREAFPDLLCSAPLGKWIFFPLSSHCYTYYAAYLSPSPLWEFPGTELRLTQPTSQVPGTCGLSKHSPSVTVKRVNSWMEAVLARERKENAGNPRWKFKFVMVVK